ncbi:MAG TPA: PQQ-dependent methanol/ethanol family dehydrogenase [Rhodospirillales bacterium]|nr:PQQ-dependent methanol/ethanol family dehydrogenase [Rhodospirillales bacterium]
MRSELFAATAALSLSIFIAAGGQPAAAAVTDEDLLNGAKNTKQVVNYGIDLQNQRFSPLDKLTPANAKGLVPVWAFSFGGEKQRGQEAQPLVYDGIVYVTASYSRLFAIDVKTGNELWQYDARLPEGILPCCDVINRGAAIYGDMVYFGTLDAKVVALDRKTGKVVWSKKIDDYQDGYTITAAPLIVKGKVIIGNAGGEFGVVGRVRALDAKTGAIVWERPTIEGHMGTLNGKESTMTGSKPGATWPGDMWKNGGGAPWNGVTYDPVVDLIYTGTGNPSPWNAHMRPGDNLYSASKLALNPDTGDIAWSFQTTPGDGWDFDSMSEFVPFDIQIDGKTVKAGASADKNGFFYVLDRTNGKMIKGFPFVEKITWAKGLAADGKPIYDPANRPPDPSAPAAATPAAVTTADGHKAVFVVPSFLGGKNWNPMAYSPDTGLFYVPANEWGMDIWNEPIAYKKGAAYLGAGFTIKPVFDDHIGALKAIDPKTGAVKWTQKNAAPLWAGVLATKGGLVFTGTPEGFIKAFDASTGAEVWKFQTGSGVIGSPITWEMDGEQYIGVVSGWGGAVPLWGGEVAKFVKDLNQGGSFWVFKLPKT